MQKRTMVIIGAVIVLLLGGAGAVYARTRTTTTPQYWAQAKATKASSACLAPNPKLVVPANARNSIEMSAISYLIDVPAGTNVDVKLATYTPTNITGSDYYPAKYGTYNFALAKQADGWHVTDFKHCY